MYRAVLDTVALVPGKQRDFLLSLAREGAYTPVWSSGTIGELDDVLARLDECRGVPDRPEYRARLLEHMHAAFPGARIEAPREREYGYDIADEFDGHVVHAAISGKADALVTGDKKAKFEECTALIEAQVEVISVADFAANCVSAHIDAGVRAVRAMSERFVAPPMAPLEILDLLAERYGMHDVKQMLAPRIAL
ncbi:PIN domain-containing protein [Microbacterium arborescens]|uniref:PIN domain-containing protein n=1 Tax=Microbacterium arborescens TaxID=33883 RepID=UPI002788A563|nr:PIN domain-containing protein [Microbacterium arborescens]MDQ1215462.1 putative nucleic acid-binding protein [Microbacterium arborescens]